MESSGRELTWLRRARDLSHLLARERDVRKLLPMILDAAIDLTEAERGYLVKVQGKKADGGLKLKVMVARGFDGAQLKGTRGNLSRTVVRRVLDRGDRGLVTTSQEDQDVMQISSVQARRVLSIICVPLCLRGDTKGVVYLDHRFRQGAFTEADLPILQTFADQAALAMETAELLSDRSARSEQLGASLDELEVLRTRLEGQARGDSSTQSATDKAVRFGRLVGGSEEMAALYEQIERAARTWDPILICGESGTGKELVALEIHARSSRPTEPFLSENCAAVSETLLESELFGHRKGAFTGAITDRKGLFALAGRGTLFLDEVGDMSPSMQGKLLRVLQERRVRPVGSETSVPVSCRVLAATHRDLRSLVDERKFRADLYYRLDVQRVSVPPLRRRPEDVLSLVTHFADETGKRLKLTRRVQELLQTYSWPGNVRELENEVRRLLTVDAREISAQHLSDEIREGRGVARAPAGLSGKTLDEVEREMVEVAMRDCNGNKSRAARQLGIPRSTLYHLLERYGIS